MLLSRKIKKTATCQIIKKQSNSMKTEFSESIFIKI